MEELVAQVQHASSVLQTQSGKLLEQCTEALSELSDLRALREITVEHNSTLENELREKNEDLERTHAALREDLVVASQTNWR